MSREQKFALCVIIVVLAFSDSITALKLIELLTT